jgi:putative phage-type endonuclease
MKIHDLVQGSPEWHAYRADHWNASDAPAMMGVSPYKTRSQFLHERHTGLRSDSTPEQERIFAAGHAYEAQARPLAELIIGESLYPVVASDGAYSASFDGITMAEDTVFEHKSLNDELRACMPVNDGLTIPEDVVLPMVYRVQNEQQLKVSNAGRLLFMASKWAGETLVEERHCWYLPDLELRARIVAGWAQFEADLAAYVPAAAAAPAPVGKAPESLPALHIEVKGQVTASNLAAFKTAALAVIRSVNRELKTDEDFANAEKAVKWCEDTEERLAAAKQQALAQTATIEALFRTIDEISAEARDVRLALTKDVKARKEAIKGEIVAGAIAAFAQHIQAMACPHLPRIAADFAGAAKNKRTVASLRDAVDTELARVKIEANGHYQRIQQSLAALAQHQAHAFLFSDVGALVLKSPDDLALVIRTRIADHEAKEVTRREDETARIRAEEQARADREATAKAQAELAAQRQADADAFAKQRATLTGDFTPPAPTPIIARGESPAGKAIMAAAPAPRADEPATLNLGAISDRLELTVSAAFMVKVGLEGAPGPRGSKLYTENQFTQLCHAIARHCMEAAAGVPA